jgi:hypothetical protein
MPEVTCYLLVLLKKKEGSGHDDVSIEVRPLLKEFYGIAPLNESDPGFHENESDDNNHSCYWSGKFRIVDRGVEREAIIRHYKMRIIFEYRFETERQGTDRWFEEARDGIDRITKRSDLLRLKELERSLLGECGRKGVCSHATGMVSHPLAVIDFEYRSADFAKLGHMALTTFTYELPDSRRLGRLDRLKFRTPTTLLRISRPCIITSRMSKYLLFELINVLYDTLLYEKRLRPDQYEKDEDVFHKVKDGLGRALHDVEAGNVGAQNAVDIYRLSVIMGLGSLASIMALVGLSAGWSAMRAAPWVYVATVLGLAAIWVLGGLMFRRK